MKPIEPILAVLLMGAGLFFAFDATASASQRPQSGSLPPTAPGPHATIAFEDAEPSTPLAVLEQAPFGIPGWSKLSFQSLRHGNWEIFQADADGSNQVRITQDPGIDYAPRLSPGADRIAFASDRSGDFDIYVVNWGGAGLVALTNNTSDDVAPAWSPTGSKLAFASDRDGQYEIYVMNANGSASVRLTNHSADDYTPAWSPDGTKIAFVSRRTGSFQVWVMNADGSNPRALTSFPSAYDPAWSPDGTQIAFDADGDDDGFEELWLMNADGSGQRLIYDPPQSNQTAWTGSWSVDGRYIAFSRITLQGTIATEAVILAWDSHNPGSILSLSSGNRDIGPDWQSTRDPDLWVAQGHSAGLPGRQVDLMLAYGNRGAATARNVRVSLDLPAGVTFISADPPPSATSPTLRWTKSSLPASSSQTVIRITVQVDGNALLGSTLGIRAEVTSDTSEPDTTNNTAEATLYVGWEGYQPLVVK